MTALITMNDGGGPVSGSILTTATTVVQLSNFDDTGVLGHLWTLRDRPQGSGAALSSTTSPNPTLTPDVPGTYLIELQTFRDVARTDLDDADVQAIGVPLSAPFDWRIPAAGETRQFDSTRGWASARETAIREMHGFMTSGIAAHVGVVDRDLNAPNVEVVLGGFVYDGSRLPATGGWLRLLARLDTPDPGAVVELRLYDLGAPGTPILPVRRATATIDGDTHGSNAAIDDVPLSVVASPGVDADEIHNVRRLYELRGIIVGTAFAAKLLWGGIALDGA